MEVAVLEVGLGGRLDAVNLIDPDVAVVTTIGIDHVAWLGDNRESIGAEKAGIFRAGRPAVCGDPEPPASLLERARSLGAPLRRLGHEFRWEEAGERWHWYGDGVAWCDLPRPRLELQNAATALMALACVKARLQVEEGAIHAGLRSATLPGRFQVLEGAVPWILDVAQNPRHNFV